MLKRSRREARGLQVEKMREMYYKRKMIDIEEMERERKKGKDFSKDLEQADRTEQTQ